MSYLLRNRNATNPLGGGSHNKGSRFLPPNRSATAGMYRLSSGGAQLQIQRPQQTIQQKPAPQQPQQRVAGIISMEEVLADLRILETQQQESERKLHHARITKQRRLEQQASLEEKLDKFKYQNGQQRAELQRAHELLSEGQRQLSSARKAAAKAGDDLRDFDRKLKTALEIKFSLVTHQHTQDRLIEVLHKKVESFVFMKHSSEQRLNKAKQDLQNAKRLEETLRLDISNEIVRHQRISDKTAKVDAEYTESTECLDSYVCEEAALKLQIEAIEKEANVLKIQDSTNQEAFKSHEEEHQKFISDITADRECHARLIQEKTSRLRQIWHEAASVQKSEGHTPCHLPSNSSSPPVLDIACISDSVNAEVSAVAEETMAKEHLSVSVEDLKKKLASLQHEFDKNSSILAEQEAINVKQLQVEEDMQASNDELLTKYECVCKTFDEKNYLKRQHLSARNVEVTELQKSLDSVSNDVREANCLYQSHRESLSGIDDDIIDIKAERDEMKNLNQQTLSKLEGDLANIRRKVEELRDATDKENCDLFVDETSSQDRHRRKAIEEAKTKISKLLNVYPEIEKIKIQYRPDLSDREQAHIDLKRFVQKCKKSIDLLDAKIEAMEKTGVKKSNDCAPEVASALKQSLISSKSSSSDHCDFEGKSIGESTAKPRSLLPLFLRNNDKNSEQSDFAAGEANLASSKKVRWRKDYDDSGDLEDIEYGTQTAVEMVKGSAKRKSFGSSGRDGRNESRGTNAKEFGSSSRSLSVGSGGLSNSKMDTAKERIGEKRSRSRSNVLSGSSLNSDSKRRRVPSVDCSDEAFANQSGNVTIIKPAALSKSLNREFSSATIKTETKSSHKRSKIGDREVNVCDPTKSDQASRKMLSFSSECNASKTQKVRVSSAQFSGISSQERPSKGRRRNRGASGASVGNKSGRTNFLEEEYSFNFTS